MLTGGSVYEVELLEINLMYTDDVIIPKSQNLGSM